MSVEMSIFLFIFSLLNLFITIVNTFTISKLYERISKLEITYEFESNSEEFSDSEDNSYSENSSDSESKIKLD